LDFCPVSSDLDLLESKDRPWLVGDSIYNSSFFENDVLKLFSLFSRKINSWPVPFEEAPEEWNFSTVKANEVSSAFLRVAAPQPKVFENYSLEKCRFRNRFSFLRGAVV